MAQTLRGLFEFYGAQLPSARRLIDDRDFGGGYRDDDLRSRSADSRTKVEAWLAQNRGKHRNYFAAAVFVLIWIAVTYWAWTAFRD